MIQILLADDDILSLNRLSGLFDWNANGYEIVGQALGGADCLKLVDKFKPDILILDIDMPDKNGVEVTKQLQEQHSKTKILILSNYDTYDFVRDAMRYGAFDYLLKHQLTAGILLNKLQEMKSQLEKEGMSISHLSYFTTVAKQKYLQSLLKNGITNQEEHRHMKTQEDFSSRSFCLSVLQITNFILITHFSPDMDREKLIESIMTLATNIFASLHNGLITYMEYGQFVILFHYNESSTSEILSRVSGAMRLVVSNIQKVFGLSAMYQASDIFTDIAGLPGVFGLTARRLEQQPFSGASPRSAALPEVSNSLDIQDEKVLMDALAEMDIIKIKTLLQDIFSRYTSASGCLSQQIIFQLLQLGIRFQKEKGLEFLKDTDAEFRNMNFSAMSQDAVFRLLSDYFVKIVEHNPEYGISHYSFHIQNAILYIHQNYKEDISLSSLADRLHISPTHLSRLFSKEVGTSFIDYMVPYRVDKARQLICHSNLDLKTIAEQAGFHSYNYFLRTYKEKTGHTPTQDMNSKRICAPSG